MKRGIHALLMAILLLPATLQAQQQTSRGGGHDNDHGGPESNCFNTQIVHTEKIGEHCTEYKFKITSNGDCDHALSHYTVAIPCGKVKDLRNSEGWKQEFGFDPKTQLTGFKIDDICNFGEGDPDAFYVKFVLCAYDSVCKQELKCWEPVVAYKASTNIFYDTLSTGTCASLAASLQAHDASCYGGADGSASVTVTEGQAPYSYTWSNGATTAMVTGLAAGTYSVVVRDAAGEEVTLHGAVLQPNAIVISGTALATGCAGQANGAIDITVAGGNGGYRYTWSNGATTQDITALAAGTYAVTVHDSTGCSAQKSFTIATGAQITLSATSVLPGCNKANGSITVAVTGGTEPYTYLWSNGATTKDLQNVAAGLYKITVTDSSGCAAQLAYNLRDNNTLKLNATVTPTSCLDDASGAADLIVTGGTPPYTYAWSNGATTEDLTGLIAGIYKVTVTDANGCTSMITVNVSKKTFESGVAITQPTCAGQSTGSIVLNPTGGVAPYTYVWSNGTTGNSLTGLAPGVYTVTVTDASGCSRLFTFIINNPLAITATATVQNGACNAEGQFAIDLTPGGGKPPYTYSWSNGATTEDLTGLNSGTYTVVITDANGCTLTKEVIVNGGTSGWACLITPPDSIPACGSAGNMLQTAVAAATYQWSVQSSDGQWVIVSGATSSGITYTAGGANTTATFSLTVTKDGCTQTCTYAFTACVDNDGEEPGEPGGEEPGEPGGEEPGEPGGENPGEPGGGDETCEECFDSSIKIVDSDDGCKTYRVTVSTDGHCRHDLSHWTIAIPCGTLSGYNNSEGWKMEIGKDPTTGLTGLKVDDIDGFGKERASFTVTFTVCYENNSCHETLKTWNPVVAYKAGQCVDHDTIHPSDNDDSPKVCAYPNPFHGNLRFDWKCDDDDYVELDIVDKCGKEVKKVYKGHVWKGESYSFECSGENLNEDLYIYRFTSRKKKTQYGKLIKKR